VQVDVHVRAVLALKLEPDLGLSDDGREVSHLDLLAAISLRANLVVRGDDAVLVNVVGIELRARDINVLAAAREDLNEG